MSAPASHPLLDLARDSSADARSELVARTAELFLNDTGDATPAEMEHCGAVLAKLYQYARQDVRAKLSAALAMSDWAPLELVREIAADTFEIAQPIISFCPVLDETGLVRVVEVGGVEHRVCVAGRDNIGEAVTEALVNWDDPLIMEALAENKTARMAPETFGRALDIVRDDPRLVDMLVTRPDLPAALVAAAYSMASQDARTALKKRIPPGLEARLNRLAEIVCVEATRQQVDTLPVSHDPDGGPGKPGGKAARVTVGQILSALVRGDRNRVLRGLADILGINGAALARRLSDGEAESFALVARGAGFEVASVRPLADLVGRAGRTWGREDDRAVALVWMRMSQDSARQSVQVSFK